VAGFLKRITAALAAGAILRFYSGFLFGAVLRRDLTFAGYFLNYLYYSLMAYAFLCVVHHFRVASVYAVFLAGAFFGWLVEGVAASSVYSDLPYTLVWTGLSWHALISVLFGWHLGRKILLRNDCAATIMFAAALGLFWAAWAAFWPQETGKWVALPHFAKGAFLFTAVLVAGYWVSFRVPTARFKPTVIEQIGVALIAVLWFVKSTAPEVKPAYLLVVTPAAVAVTLFFVWLNRRTETAPSVLVSVQGRVSTRNVLLLFFAPALTVYGYAMFRSMEVELPSNSITYVLTQFVAVALYAASALKTIERRPASPANSPQ
jgi:hypothetical protein